MPEPKEKVKTIEDFRKAFNNPKLEVSEPIIVHYGKIALHIQPDGVIFDQNDLTFHQIYRVVKEIKPVRKPRTPKAVETQASGKLGKK